MAPSLLWFRADLRLSDNPALYAACAAGAVIPVFIWAPDEEGVWAPGAASRWWLHHSLASLETSLTKAGSRLIIRRGPSAGTLLEIARDAGATSVFLNRRYEPACEARDAGVAERLRAEDIEPRRFKGTLLHEPSEVATQSGGPYQVYTPFWRSWSAMPPVARLHGAPRRIEAPPRWPSSLGIPDLGLLPRVAWYDEMKRTWTPGEAAAKAALDRFLTDRLDDYDAARDHPFDAGTSRLSPHLHFGELSVREALLALAAARPKRPSAAKSADHFHRELAWREFAHHLLVHFPHTPGRALRGSYDKFPWRKDPEGLKRWQKGETGFPIVDAGMRELWRTGWMHNRVRMIVASFLVKDLLIDWREGARWFWDTLVDADLANNTLGWQWAAGCGADAAPFFRIFNPTMQGEKFDPDGAYVKRWVPELAKLPARWIHKPWEAPQDALWASGVRLGETYPVRVVDHAQARVRALAALKRISR